MTRAGGILNGGLSASATAETYRARKLLNEHLSWKGMDVIPMRDGLIARKDVYADSISLLKQLGVASR